MMTGAASVSGIGVPERDPNAMGELLSQAIGRVLKESRHFRRGSLTEPAPCNGFSTSPIYGASRNPSVMGLLPSSPSE